MATRPVHVLVTCGGKWVGIVLQLKAALAEPDGGPGGGKVFVASSEANTPAGHFADGAFQVPPIADAEYVQALLALCVRERVTVVVPLIDLDVERLAPHRDAFAAVGASIVAPPVDVVALCFDKVCFRSFTDLEHLPSIPTVPRESLAAARYPLFYKRRRGFGSLGSGVCDSYEDAVAILERAADTLFQPVIAAQEYSVDAYVARDGRCVACVQRARDKVMGGEVVRSHTVFHAGVAEVARRTIDALSRRGLRGPLNLQVFDGDPPLLIEVNTRIGSGFVLSNMATGGRLLRSLVAEGCGGTAEGEPDDYVRGMGLYRFFGDLFLADGRVPVAVPGRIDV